MMTIGVMKSINFTNHGSSATILSIEEGGMYTETLRFMVQQCHCDHLGHCDGVCMDLEHRRATAFPTAITAAARAYVMPAAPAEKAA